MNSRKSLNDFETLNMDIIHGTWAEEAWKYLLANITKTFLNWTLIVFNLTDDETLINQWVKTFQEEYEDTSCDLLTEISKLRDTHLINIEKSLEKLQMLCKTLQIDLPKLECQTLNLFRQYYMLQQEIEQREQILHERNETLHQLQKRELELCTLLGIAPTIKTTGVPSPKEIEIFKNTIEKLEEERCLRIEKYHAMKKDIIEIANELNWKPSTQFENIVMTSDLFIPSAENMTQLYNFHNGISEQCKHVSKEISKIQDDIDDLWKILDVSPINREQFQISTRNAPLSMTLEMAKMELSRCQHIKEALDENRIIQAKTTLQDLWEKCHCSDELKQNFMFESNSHVDNMLELFEMEVQKWNTYYQENQELLVLLEKHKKISQKVLELDEKSCDPTRFKNRGGQLLKEERERTRFSKQVAEIERSLYSLANKFELRHNVQFTTYGQTVDGYVKGFYARRQEVNKSVKLRCPRQSSTVRTSLENGKRKLTTPVDRIVTSKKRRSKERNIHICKIIKRDASAKKSHQEDPSLLPRYEDFQQNLRLSCNSTLN